MTTTFEQLRVPLAGILLLVASSSSGRAAARRRSRPTSRARARRWWSERPAGKWLPSPRPLRPRRLRRPRRPPPPRRIRRLSRPTVQRRSLRLPRFERVALPGRVREVPASRRQLHRPRPIRGCARRRHDQRDPDRTGVEIVGGPFTLEGGGDGHYYSESGTATWTTESTSSPRCATARRSPGSPSARLIERGWSSPPRTSRHPAAISPPSRRIAPRRGQCADRLQDAAMRAAAVTSAWS